MRAPRSDRERGGTVVDDGGRPLVDDGGRPVTYDGATPVDDTADAQAEQDRKPARKRTARKRTARKAQG